MPATVTVTGHIGPGNVLTAKVFTDVLSFEVDTRDNVLKLEFADGVFTFISVDAATTVTATKALKVWTLVIS